MSQILLYVGLNSLFAAVLALFVWISGMIPVIRFRPGLRHGLWFLVLIKLVTPPVVELSILPTWLMIGSAGDVTTTAPASAASSYTSEEPTTTLAAFGHPSDRSALSHDSSVSTPMIELSTKRILGFVARESLQSYAFLFTAIWGLGSSVVFAFALYQAVRFRSALKRIQLDNDPRLKEATVRIANKLAAPRVPAVCVVNARVSPLLWVNWSRPMIVLPRSLVSRMTDEQVDCIIAHEIAHYRRRDHLTNALSLIVGAICWWNPIVWWARREMRIAQEACCDSLVINCSNASRKVYAQTLFQALEFLNSERTLSLMFASGFGGKSSTQRRFEMIANAKVNHRLSWWSYPLLAAMLAALPLLPAIARAQQVDSGSDRLVINGVEYVRAKPTERVDTISTERKVKQKAAGDATPLKVHQATSRSLRIPVNLDAESRKRVILFELHGSSDEGKTWKKVAECQPDGKLFEFTVPADGLYWFAKEVIIKYGDPNPIADWAHKPDMVVLVKSDQPAPEAKTIYGSTTLGAPLGPEVDLLNSTSLGTIQETTKPAIQLGYGTELNTPSRGTPAPLVPAIERTNAKLQGAWQIMSISLEGNVFKTEDALEPWKETFSKKLVVEGDRLIHAQVAANAAKFTLDETRSPNEINIEADGGQLTFRGIFAIDGDSLRLCVNGNGADNHRPTEFVSKPGTAQVLVTLKKAPIAP